MSILNIKGNSLSGPLAQLVEHFPFKEGVDGSSPSGLTTKVVLFYLVYTIGGYSNIILFIQLFKFSILFLLEGWVLKN